VNCRKGGALLAVLWLTAALSAIAFGLASRVEAETERAQSGLEGIRAYYLAQGAVDRALTWISWAGRFRNPDGTARYYEAGMSRLLMDFPTGQVLVEIQPEAAKMNLNRIPVPDLQRLLVALGEPPDRAFQIALAIEDWRTAAPEGASLFDQFYLSMQPSFRARHASFEETEELLLVRGVTPDLYYGRYQRDAAGRLWPRGGLRDCLSPWGAWDAFDANTVHPAVLAALGMGPAEIQALENRRRMAPFRKVEELNAFKEAVGPSAQRLKLGAGSMLTLRATARLKLPNGGLSDMRRSVAMTVKYMPEGSEVPLVVMRWYDNAFSDRNVF
jgi:general secretion pathway protein K